MTPEPDFNFSHKDLADVLHFVKEMVDAELAPNFSGGHVVLVHKAWQRSPTGMLWAAFLLRFDCGLVVDTTMKLFSTEPEATEYLDDIIANDFTGLEIPRATRH